MLFQEAMGQNWHGEIEGCWAAVSSRGWSGNRKKELEGLEKSKNVDGLGEAEKIVQLQKDKRKKRKIFEFSN